MATSSSGALDRQDASQRDVLRHAMIQCEDSGRLKLTDGNVKAQIQIMTQTLTMT